MGRTAIATLGAALLSLASPALAVDGKIEISQANFPLIITTSGSYVVTGDLVAPVDTTGIWIQADDVTLDIGGFTITGSGTELRDGVSVTGSNVEVRNGTVQGFGRYGVFAPQGADRVRVIDVRAQGNRISGITLQGESNTVDRCTAVGNGAAGALDVGIRVGFSSLILNSVATGNQSHGLLLGAGSGYRSNVANDNNGGNANPQVSGGIELGPNICAFDATCP